MKKIESIHEQGLVCDSRGRSGQAVVEYILLLALVLTVVLGVFWPIFQTKVSEAVFGIRDRAVTVLSQPPVPRGSSSQPYGIPLEWFGIGKNELGVDNPLGRGGPGEAGSGSSGSGPGDGSSGDGNAQVGDGEGSAGPGGRPGAGRRTGRRGSGGGGDEEASGSAGSPGSSGESSSEESSQSGRRSRNSRNSKSSGGGDQFSNSPGAVPESGPTAETATETATEAELNRRRRASSGVDGEQSDGSCENFNVFMLLKIVALIGIVLVLAVIIFKGKNSQAGSDNADV